LRQGLGHARRRLPSLPDRSIDEVAAAVAKEGELLTLLGRLLEQRFGGRRIRIHGDFRLEQVLSTGRDFVVYDFQGDTTRPITERRLKRSPLADVAGMLRSLHYVAMVALDEQAELIGMPLDDLGEAAGWPSAWYAWAAGAFLTGYVGAIEPAGLIPAEPAQRRALLDTYLIDRAARELSWEVDNRPGLAHIPALGLLGLAGGGATPR
jgi:maltose alpha-D-glucosyltransferase/alpha-amylase